jgi:hypothetical protein
VLAPYGVTNDRLDTVSNYYRYRPDSGRLWTHTDAEITADVRNGKVIGFTVVNSGAGYTTPPPIEIPGFPNAKATASLTFTTDLAKNGSINKVSLEVEKR